MAIYTYDAEADVLYVLLVDDEAAAIERTEEIDPVLHVDLDADGQVIGVEFLYPRINGVPVSEVRERYGIELEVPFSFAA
jgi:uncharacterized protein YuzE